MAILLVTLAQPWQALSAADDWRLSGDVRIGYFSLDRAARSGAKSDDSHTWMRLRVAAERERIDRDFYLRISGRF